MADTFQTVLRRSARIAHASNHFKSSRISEVSNASKALDLPIEIWAAIGELIYSRETFKALVLVCRELQAIFEPFLHSNLGLQLHEIHPSVLKRKGVPSFLQHTKEFVIRLDEWLEPDLKYKLSMNEGYASSISKMLKEMSKLRIFKFLNHDFENLNGPCLILRRCGILEVLKESQTLQHVCVEFGAGWKEESVVAAERCDPIIMHGFRNLRSLEIYNFQGKNSTQLAITIGRVLSENPGLKCLGLGMCVDADCWDLPEAVIVEPDHDSLLEDICFQYGRMINTQPLQLDTLRLGVGLYLFKSKTEGGGNYLSKLVHTSCLRRLQLFNGYIKCGDDPWNASLTRMRTDWSQLGRCESIRHLSITNLQSDVMEWLEVDAKSVEELIVTYENVTSDRELNHFNYLNLPSLSMLFLRETAPGIKFSEPWRHRESKFLEKEGLTYAELAKSVQDEAEVFTVLLDSKSRFVSLGRFTVSVLDRLPDGGASLTRLGLCLHFETQWDQFALHLPSLKQLTQLRVDTRDLRCPTGTSSKLWPHVKIPRDIARRYARFMHSQCPSLQYVQINEWSWQLMRIYNHGKKSPKIKLELRELDYDEKITIELFAMAHFPEQANLPSIDRPFEGDEGSLEYYQHIEEIEASLRRAGPGSGS